MIGLLVYKYLHGLAPQYLSDNCILGADIIHLPNTTISPAPGASSYRPSNENNWPSQLLSCLVRILELASCRSARP